MQEYKGAILYTEPDDIETLYFSPSWYDDGVTSQSVAIAPLKNNELSVIMCKRWKNYPDSFVRFVFTKEEVDILIEAMQEAKRRWVSGKVIGS